MRRHGPARSLSRVTGTVAALFVALITGCSAPGVQAPATPRPPASITSSAIAPTGPTAATAAPPAHVTNLRRAVPLRLQIPAIGVDTTLIPLGLKADRSLQTPPRGFPAGWYTGAVTPGEVGPAILLGHVDGNGPAVFFRLHDLTTGDRVTVSRADGTKPVFRVVRLARYPKRAFPTALVYGPTATSTLRLITCGGTFNTQSGHYQDNLVVFADLIR